MKENTHIFIHNFILIINERKKKFTFYELQGWKGVERVAD
jgi:hypothetical protein